MPDTPPRQIIHFHHKHYEAVVAGEKVTTVRWNEEIRTGAATFVFDEHPTAPALSGHVTEVTPHRLSDLTPEAAHQPDGTDMAVFAQQLRTNYYPTMPADAVVHVAVITLDAPESFRASAPARGGARNG